MNLLATLAVIAVHPERWRWLPRRSRDAISRVAFWLAIALLAGHLVVIPALLLDLLGQGVVLPLIGLHVMVVVVGHDHEPRA